MEGNIARQLTKGYNTMQAGGDGRSNGVGGHRVGVDRQGSGERGEMEWREIAAWVMGQMQMVCSIDVPQQGGKRKSNMPSGVDNVVGMVGGDNGLCVRKKL